jgi:hypothetical protein
MHIQSSLLSEVGMIIKTLLHKVAMFALPLSLAASNVPGARVASSTMDPQPDIAPVAATGIDTNLSIEPCGDCEDHTWPYCATIMGWEVECHAWEYNENGDFDRGNDSHSLSAAENQYGMGECATTHDDCIPSRLVEEIQGDVDAHDYVHVAADLKDLRTRYTLNRTTGVLQLLGCGTLSGVTIAEFVIPAAAIEQFHPPAKVQLPTLWATLP